MSRDKHDGLCYNNSMNKRFWKKRNLAIIGLAAGGLVIAGTATVRAADNSAPGDPLYGLDTALESVQLAAATNDTAKADRHLKIAQEKLREMEKLQNNPMAAERIAEAARRVEEHRSKAQVSAGSGKLSQQDAARIKSQLHEVSTKQQQTLREVLNKVPVEARPGVERAIQTTDEAIKRAIQQVDRALENSPSR
jgi:hypothetical protein